MRALKVALFVLLAANTVYFGLSGSASKFVDSAAWLVLLALFQAETDFPRLARDARRRSIVRALRLVAAAAVFAAVIGYVFEENMLDAVNSALWIAVVVLLEIEVRFGGRLAAGRRALLTAVYGALAVLVVLWAWRGMWLDAYDALLWLAAFVTLELGLVSKHAPAPR